MQWRLTNSSLLHSHCFLPMHYGYVRWKYSIKMMVDYILNIFGGTLYWWLYGIIMNSSGCVRCRFCDRSMVRDVKYLLQDVFNKDISKNSWDILDVSKACLWAQNCPIHFYCRFSAHWTFFPVYQVFIVIVAYSGHRTKHFAGWSKKTDQLIDTPSLWAPVQFGSMHNLEHEWKMT